MSRTARTAGGIALAAVALALGSDTRASSQATATYAPGYCLAFDGAHDYVRVPRSASLEPDELTVELWARLDGPQSQYARLVRKASDGGPGYLLAADQVDQRMQLRIDGPIHAEAKDTAPNTDYIGAWHHFAGVFSIDTAEFWVDGRLVRRVEHAPGPMTHATLTDLFIGCGLPSTIPTEFFHGRIDEVRIWSYARSHADISDNIHARMVGDEPGLVGYWNFDEGSGQVAHDSSSQHNDGELGSTPAPDENDPRWQPSRALIEPLP